MPRETEKEVRKVINKNYIEIINNLDPDCVIGHLRASGVLTVAGYDTYHEELKNMMKCGKTKSAVNERLIEILFTRENWWIPFIKALRECGVHKIAKIIEDVLPKSERQKLERTRQRSSMERTSRRSSRPKEPVYSASEASTDAYDSDSDSSYNTATRKKFEGTWRPNPRYQQNGDPSRHWPRNGLFEDFTVPRQNLGEALPDQRYNSENFQFSEHHHWSESRQPPYVGSLHTSHSLTTPRSTETVDQRLLRSKLAPLGPAQGSPQSAQYQDQYRIQCGQQPPPEHTHVNGGHYDARQVQTGHNPDPRSAEAMKSYPFNQNEHPSPSESGNVVNPIQGMSKVPESDPRNQHAPNPGLQQIVSSDAGDAVIPLTLDTPVRSVPTVVVNIFQKLDYITDKDWKEFAGLLTNKFHLEDEHRIESKRDESKTRQVIGHFAMVEGERATFGRMILALQQMQRIDLLNDIEKMTGLKFSDDEEVDVNWNRSRVDLDFKEPGITPGDGTRIPLDNAGDNKPQNVSALGATVLKESKSLNICKSSRQRTSNDADESEKEDRRIQGGETRDAVHPVDGQVILSQLNEARKLDEAIKVQTQELQGTEQSSPPRNGQGTQEEHPDSLGSDVSDENNLHQEGDTIVANKNQNLQKPSTESKVINTEKPPPGTGTTEKKDKPTRESSNMKIHHQPPSDVEDKFGPKIDLPHNLKSDSDGTVAPVSVLHTQTAVPAITQSPPPRLVIGPTLQPYPYGLPQHQPYPYGLPHPQPHPCGLQQPPTNYAHLNQSYLGRMRMLHPGQYMVLSIPSNVPQVVQNGQMQIPPKAFDSTARPAQAGHKAMKEVSGSQTSPLYSESSCANLQDLGQTSSDSFSVSTLGSDVLEEPSTPAAAHDKQAHTVLQRENSNTELHDDEEEEEEDDDDDNDDSEDDKEEEEEEETCPKHVYDESSNNKDETLVKQATDFGIESKGTEEDDCINQNTYTENVNRDTKTKERVTKERDKIKVHQPPDIGKGFGPKTSLPCNSKLDKTRTAAPLQIIQIQTPLSVTPQQSQSVPVEDISSSHPAMNYAHINKPNVPRTQPRQNMSPECGAVLQPAQPKGVNIPRFDTLGVGCNGQDQTLQETVSDPAGPPQPWEDIRCQYPQTKPGSQLNFSSHEQTYVQTPPPDLNQTSNGSFYLSSLNSSVVQEPSAADYRNVRYPAHIMSMSLPSVPPSCHERQAQTALKQSMHPNANTEYELVTPRPCKEDDDISIDEGEAVSTAYDGPRAASTGVPPESSQSPIGHGGRAETVEMGATSNVKNGLKTMFKMFEWVTVASDTNMLHKWHSA